MLTIASSLLMGGVPAAHAQGYTTIATLDSLGYSGSAAGRLVEDEGGNLYGILAISNRNSNLIYKIASGSNTPTALTSFDTYYGNNHEYDVTIDAGGNLYGVTHTTQGDSVFRIAAGTSDLTAIATFSPGSSLSLNGGLTFDAAGNLYDTSQIGGSLNWGTAFKVAAGTNATTVLDFGTDRNVYSPRSGPAVDAAGNQYILSPQGGTGYGSIVKVAPDMSQGVTIATLNGTNGDTSNSNQSSPLAVDVAGNIYGVAINGGANNLGTVFKVDALTHVVTTLVTFNGTNGMTPLKGVTVDSVGNLFGVAGAPNINGNSVFNVFEIAHATNDFTTLATFIGERPAGELLLDGSGNLYGSTQLTNSTGVGHVFRISTNSVAGSASAPEPGAMALAVTALPIAALAMRRRKTA